MKKVPKVSKVKKVTKGAKNKYLTLAAIGLLAVTVFVFQNKFESIKEMINESSLALSLLAGPDPAKLVGYAYNAYNCKNEFYKGTKNPYPVQSIYKGLVNDLSIYPIGYYGLSSVKLTIPKGYTAFIGTKGTSKERLADVGYTLTVKDGTACINLGRYNDKGSAIMVAPKCSIIGVAGRSSDGSFPAEIDRLINVWKKSNPEKDVYVKLDNGAQDASVVGPRVVDYVNFAKIENSQKTLVLLHSLSAVAAFNRGIKSDQKMKVVLYDPMYDAIWMKVTPSWTPGNAGEIIKAAKAGIAKSTDLLNLSDGKGSGPAHSDLKPLAGIVTPWLEANCK
jgi:hypothetical protein